MNKVTIAEAFKMFQDIQEKEELIQQIVGETGATRKAVVRKLGQLMSDGIIEEKEEEEDKQDDSDWTEKMYEVTRPETDDSFEDEDEDPVKQALISENSKLKRQLKKILQNRGSEELNLERLTSDIQTIKPFPIIYKPQKQGDKKEATLVSLLADFHIGAKEYIPGFNKFDYSIACRRVNTYLKKVLDWCELHRNSYIVDEICICCLGDMISGDIHDELIRTNEFSCPEQVKKASELLSSLFASLAPHFKKVRIEFVVPDNHSRVTQKIEFADGTNSYNYLVGHLTKALVSGHKNIEFNIYPQIQQIIKVHDRRYLIMHGNCVRGGGGALFPMTGITRKLWRESHLRMNMSEDMHFDKILMGHYHAPCNTPDLGISGCLVSSTGFDMSAARHTPACITSFFVCGKYEFDYTEFWLNEGETY